MKRRSFLLVFLIVSLIVVLPTNFVPSVQATPDTEYLYVDALGTEKTDWTEVGTTPFLDEADDGDYIWTNKANDEHGDFSFTDHGVSGTITAVYFEIYAKKISGSGLINSDIWNGTSWIDLPNKGFGASYEWSTERIDDSPEYINTWDKVDALKAYFTNVATGQPPTHYIEAARIKVEYSPSAPEPMWTTTMLNVSSYINETGGGWETNGSTPYLDAQDYPTNYVYTEEQGNTIGCFYFQKLGNNATIKQVYLNVSYWTSDDVCKVRCYIYNHNNDTWVQLGDATAGSGIAPFQWEWTRFNLTGLTFPFWRPDVKVKFMSVFGDPGIKRKIDHVFLEVTWTTRTKMMGWLFDQAVQRRVNSTMPYVRGWDETDQDYKDTASVDLLTGASYYLLTGNTTFLDYAYETANWINNSGHIEYLMKDFYWETNNWTLTLDSGCASRILSLCVLADINSSYISMVQEAVDYYLATFLNLSTYRLKQSETENRSYAANTGKCLAALGYAYALTNNETIKDIGVRIVMNYTLSPVGLPHAYIEQDGTTSGVEGDSLKEDQHFGQYLLGVETFYVFTKNETIKSKIETMGEAGTQYFWNSTYQHFVYRVNASTGEQIFTYAVHGFGLIDEALIQAYLICGNETCLQRARRDFDHLGLNDGSANRRILWNDLIVHNSFACYPLDHTSEVNDYWNAPAKRVALILYNLDATKIGSEFNSSYLDGYNTLYRATSFVHKRSKGWLQIVDSDNFSIYSDTSDHLIGLGLSFRNFDNVTGETIYNINDLYKTFGIPFVGGIVVSFKSLNLRVKDWDLTDNIENAKVHIDSDFHFSDSNGWVNNSLLTGTKIIKVHYYGYPVNGSFEYNLQSDTTMDVQCKLYDAYFHIIDYLDNNIQNANVTAYNTTSFDHQIRSDQTNATGYAYLVNLPNSTSLPIAAYYPDNTTLRANVTRSISSDEVVTSDITLTADITYVTPETFNATLDMILLQARRFAQSQSFLYSSQLAFSEEMLFAFSNAIAPLWSFAMLQEKLFDVSHFFAPSIQTIFGKESGFIFSDIIGSTWGLTLFQERLFGLDVATLVNSVISFSKETVMAVVEIWETINIDDGLTVLQEKLFHGTQTFVATAIITFGKETLMFAFEMWETLNVDEALAILQEKLFSGTLTFSVTVIKTFGKETISFAVEVLETIQPISLLVWLKETLFTFADTPLVSGVSTFGKEMGFLVVQVWETFSITDLLQKIFELPISIPEVGISYYGLAFMALAIALSALAIALKRSSQTEYME